MRCPAAFQLLCHLCVLPAGALTESVFEPLTLRQKLSIHVVQVVEKVELSSYLGDPVAPLDHLDHEPAGFVVELAPEPQGHATRS